ncbi:MAG: tyrosine--tRNA ligase [Acidimicrobiales bacterium]
MSAGSPSTDPGLLDDLTARGLIHDSTDRAALAARLAEGPITVYVGFDPTADSLHVGNLIGLLMLRRFQDAGHRPISLAGGATGMVGDPSGKSDERNLLDDDALAANLAGIVPQLRQFIDFEREPNPAKLLDNRAWTVGVPYLQFLRDVGKHVTVNHMVAKESVRQRMEGTEGISYTEFSYMLLQANDFRWLYEHEGCQMQMGGSDQWGNITLGGELVRRTLGGSAFALTWPLLTKPDGSKYGKTAGGETMWLSAERMSPYRFYQGWMQVEDAEVRRLLLQLTLLPIDEIEQIAAEHAAEPHRRAGQRRLAHEVTSLVHGEQAAAAAAAASAVIFGGSTADLDLPTLDTLAAEVPTAHLDRGVLGADGNLVEVLVAAGVTASKSEANRLLKQNGVSINDRKAAPGEIVTEGSLLHGRFAVIRRGKRNVSIVTFDS